MTFIIQSFRNHFDTIKNTSIAIGVLSVGYYNPPLGMSLGCAIGAVAAVGALFNRWFPAANQAVIPENEEPFPGLHEALLPFLIEPNDPEENPPEENNLALFPEPPVVPERFDAVLRIDENENEEIPENKAEDEKKIPLRIHSDADETEFPDLEEAIRASLQMVPPTVQPKLEEEKIEEIECPFSCESVPPLYQITLNETTFDIRHLVKGILVSDKPTNPFTRLLLTDDEIELIANFFDMKKDEFTAIWDISESTYQQHFLLSEAKINSQMINDLEYQNVQSKLQQRNLSEKQFNQFSNELQMISKKYEPPSRAQIEEDIRMKQFSLAMALKAATESRIAEIVDYFKKEGLFKIPNLRDC